MDRIQKRADPRAGVRVVGSGTRRREQELGRSKGDSVMVSAESHGLVNEQVSDNRVVLGVLRDAQTPVYRPHTSVETLGGARIRCTRRVRAGAQSNGYSAMVSAESHCAVNERVSYHPVVLGVLRGAQTYESRPVRA